MRLFFLLLLLIHLSPACLRAQGLRNFMPAGIRIGAAAGAALYQGNDTAYSRTLAREFNEVVAENEFKWYELQGQNGVWNFAKADQLVAFAEEHGMRLHGHVLVWHQGLPNWLETGNFTRSQLLAHLKTHIDTVVGRYKGKFYSFDVVNEAFSDQPNGAYRPSLWLNTIGRDYLDSAFVYAHQADTGLKLYYNDYNIEWRNAKSDSVLLRLNQMRQRGIPVHGVGFQGHFILDLNGGFRQSIRQNLQRFAQAGYDIRFSELDIRIPQPLTQAKRLTQGRDYANLLRLALAQPAVKSFTLWGFTDRYSWIPGFFPGFSDALIFDSAYQKKPAYDSLMAVLNTLTPVLSPQKRHAINQATFFADPGSFAAWLARLEKPWQIVDMQGRTRRESQPGQNGTGQPLPPGGYFILHPGSRQRIWLGHSGH